MFDLKNKKCLIIDSGPYSFLSEKTAEDFKEVGYYTFWKGMLPNPQKSMIGEGLSGVKNIVELWDYIKELDPKRDLICFFDVSEGDLQEFLRSLGYNVFGMGSSEKLEMDRLFFKKILETLGMPVIPYKHIKGISSLDEYLKTVKDKFVKINSYRWLTETFPHIDYDHSKSRIRMLEYNAGAYQSKIEFIIEDKLEGIEAGTDNFITDQGYYDTCLYGFEVKSKAYVCKVTETNKLPKPLKKVLTQTIPFYKKAKPRGMFSTEVRIDKSGTPYWIDATMRGGMPPSEIICEMYKNFNEAIWAVATGQKIKLEPVAPYAAQVELSSSWAQKESTVVTFPDKIKKFVKIQNLCKIDGKYKYIPQDKWDILGSAIGFGKTIEEAESNAMNNASQVVADSLEYDKSAFDTANDYIKKSKEVLGEF